MLAQTISNSNNIIITVLERHNIVLQRSVSGFRLNYKFNFDIDGTICKGHHLSDPSITPDEYNRLIADKECHEYFLNTVHQLESARELGYDIDIGFITGRKPFSKEITERMFIRAGLEKYIHNIVYYPENGKWNGEEYSVFKKAVLLNDVRECDYVFLFDDDRVLYEYLRNEFVANRFIKVFLIA